MNRRQVLASFAALPLLATPVAACSNVQAPDPMVALYREMKATLPPGYRMRFWNRWTPDTGDVLWGTATPDDGQPGPELVFYTDVMRWEVGRVTRL